MKKGDENHGSMHIAGILKPSPLFSLEHRSGQSSHVTAHIECDSTVQADGDRPSCETEQMVCRLATAEVISC